MRENAALHATWEKRIEGRIKLVKLFSIFREEHSTAKSLEYAQASAYLLRPRNRLRDSDIVFKSKKVRKSMVLNSRSMAGGPHITTPMEREALNSFGISGSCA